MPTGSTQVAHAWGEKRMRLQLSLPGRDTSVVSAEWFNRDPASLEVLLVKLARDDDRLDGSDASADRPGPTHEDEARDTPPSGDDLRMPWQQSQWRGATPSAASRCSPSSTASPPPTSASHQERRVGQGQHKDDNEDGNDSLPSEGALKGNYLDVVASTGEVSDASPEREVGRLGLWCGTRDSVEENVRQSGSGDYFDDTDSYIDIMRASKSLCDDLSVCSRTCEPSVQGPPYDEDFDAYSAWVYDEEQVPEGGGELCASFASGKGDRRDGVPVRLPYRGLHCGGLTDEGGACASARFTYDPLTVQASHFSWMDEDEDDEAKVRKLEKPVLEKASILLHAVEAGLSLAQNITC